MPQQKPVGHVTRETEKTSQKPTADHSSSHIAHHTTMADEAEEPNLPPSRTDEIAAKLKTYLTMPELCSEPKWKNFMDMGVFAFSEFCSTYSTKP